MPFIKSATDFATEIDAQYNTIARYFQAIASLGGNLPDSSLTDKIGEDDMAQLGLCLCEARRLAIEALMVIGKPMLRGCETLQMQPFVGFPVLHYLTEELEGDLGLRTSFWIGNQKITEISSKEIGRGLAAVTVIKALRNSFGMLLKDAKLLWDNRKPMPAGGPQ